MLVAVFKLISRHLRWQAGIVLVSILANAVLEVVGVGSIFWFFSLMNEPQSVVENEMLTRVRDGLGKPSVIEFLALIGAALFAVIVLRNIVGAITTWVRVRFVQQCDVTIATRLLRAYSARDYEYFVSANTAGLTKNVVTEVRLLTTGFIVPVIMMATDGAVLLAILGYLVWQHPWLTSTVVVCLGGPLGVFYWVIRARLGSIGSRMRTANEDCYVSASHALQGIKVARTLGRENEMVDAYAGAAQRLAVLGVAKTLLSQLPRYAMEVIAVGVLLGIAIYTLLTTGNSGSVIALLALFGAASLRLMPSTVRILQGVSQLKVSSAVAHGLTTDVQAGELALAAQSDDSTPIPLEEAVVVRNVSFAYQGADRPALHNVDMVIGARKSVGIVGSTGAGKTTLVDIIMGLVRPSEGELLVDDQPITLTNIRNWHRSVGYVPQESYLLDDTIARNIAYGLPDARIDQAAVERAAEMAHVHDFILGELPRSYDTKIGERGIRLSGGQRQRIGIARALYNNPSVLVFDEATSALDGVTERIIDETIRDLVGDVTTIIVAHRLNTVRNCDVIYMLDGGRIVDCGRYEELIARNRTFREMAVG